MTDYLRTPDTPADTLRDTLLGALVGLARSTSSEPKTENTDAVLNAGLRLAAQPDAPAETLQRMLDITRAEKHAVAPNCATCAMPCGNTKDYDLTRLRSAAPAVRQRKLRLLQARTFSWDYDRELCFDCIKNEWLSALLLGIR